VSVDLAHLARGKHKYWAVYNTKIWGAINAGNSLPRSTTISFQMTALQAVTVHDSKPPLSAAGVGNEIICIPAKHCCRMCCLHIGICKFISESSSR
jgi:hypothetical protein